MTLKIYDKDPWQTDFTATVLSCAYNEKKKVYEVILDQTAFFPEEGGQMPDRGILDDQTVVDVRLKREGPVDTIIHHVKKPMEAGKCVCGKIDMNHRFDQMQQHSGEHIVSGLICKTYGANNVGFHLGKEEVTLDFDVNLSLAELRVIEDLANEAIEKNFEVIVTFPTKEEAKELTYRSKIEIPGQLRLVEFPGYDKCACCAPHVSRTGQIGMIKILSAQAHRGGCRVNILCGMRARKDYTERFDSVYDISVLLSAKQNKVSEAVKRLMEENQKLKESIVRLEEAMVKAKMASLPDPSKTKDVLMIMEDLDPIAARNAVNGLTEKYDGYVTLLVGNDEKGYRILLSSAENNCQSLLNRLKKTLEIKGGGSPKMIQGTIKGASALIKESLTYAIKEISEEA